MSDNAKVLTKQHFELLCLESICLSNICKSYLESRQKLNIKLKIKIVLFDGSIQYYVCVIKTYVVNNTMM